MNPRLSLIVVFLIYASRCEGIWDRRNVTVVNNLGLGDDLVVHCKSKDDDLGPQLLHPNGAWSFFFRVNFWETTLFYCKFQWGPKKVVHWYDIFDAKSPISSDCNNCVWYVTTVGPCGAVRTAGTYVCYPWNDERFERNELSF